MHHVHRPSNLQKSSLILLKLSRLVTQLKLLQQQISERWTNRVQKMLLKYNADTYRQLGCISKRRVTYKAAADGWHTNKSIPWLCKRVLSEMHVSIPHTYVNTDSVREQVVIYLRHALPLWIIKQPHTTHNSSLIKLNSIVTTHKNTTEHNCLVLGANTRTIVTITKKKKNSITFLNCKTISLQHSSKT